MISNVAGGGPKTTRTSFGLRESFAYLAPVRGTVVLFARGSNSGSRSAKGRHFPGELGDPGTPCSLNIWGHFRDLRGMVLLRQLCSLR